MGHKKQFGSPSEGRVNGPDKADKQKFRMLEPGTEPISKGTARRINSAIVLEKIYRDVLEGKTLDEAHGGILAEATPAVRKNVRDHVMFRATNEPQEGVYKINLVEMAHKLGYGTESHHRVELRCMRKMPPQFQEALLDLSKLEEIGEALGAGRLPPILAEEKQRGTKHWRMVGALAIAAYEGSFKNSENSPLHYLMKRHGRKALVGIINTAHIRKLAHDLGVGLRKPMAKTTPEQREFIKAFAGEASDAEIAGALRLPEKTVAYFRARLRVRSRESVETEQAAAQVRKLIMGEMKKIIGSEEGILDEALAVRLQTLGFPIARRTVTKYRGLLEGEE